jgi:hypothetical protein
MIGSARQRCSDPVRIDVHRDDACARDADQPASELPDKPTADHNNPFAQRDLRQAKTVERDRGDRRKRCMIKRYAVGNARHQISRHGDDFSVVSVAAPTTGHGVAWLNATRSRAYLDYVPRRAVAHGRFHRQLSPHRFSRRAEPFAAGPLDYLLHEIRSFACLRKERFLRERNTSALRAGADDGERSPDKDAGRRTGRRRYLADGG